MTGKLDGGNEEIKLTEEQIKRFLETLKDSDLSKHYTYKEAIDCTITDAMKVRRFIASNKPITMSIKDGELYYKLSEGMEKDELFTVNTETSFSSSSKWLYDKIINVELIFPNISSASVSSEMVSFFICLLVASVLGDEFEEEFLEVITTYDFSTWSKRSAGEYDFMTLSREWVQMGSETVKMIAAAGKYAVTRNQKKKRYSITTRLTRGAGFKI